MRLNVAAVIGGVAGVAGVAAAATGLMRHRRAAGSATAAAIGSAPVSRHSRVTTSDGICLYVEEQGPVDAELTVLFVHGFTLNLRSFYLQRLALAEHFGMRVRLVAFDARSHGRSDRSPIENCTIAQLGADIRSVVDAVTARGPTVLVGHSMGGMSVMAFAAQYPQYFSASGTGRIGSVALLNTSSGSLKLLTLGLPAYLARIGNPLLPLVLRYAGRGVDVVERTRALTKDLARILTKRLSFASPDVSPEMVAFATDMIAATPVDVVAAFFSAVVGHDGREGLSALGQCDVLVVGAAQDAMIGPEHCISIAGALAHSRLEIVENAGHLLMLERPAVVNELLFQLVSDELAALAAVTDGGRLALPEA